MCGACVTNKLKLTHTILTSHSYSFDFSIISRLTKCEIYRIRRSSHCALYLLRFTHIYESNSKGTLSLKDLNRFPYVSWMVYSCLGSSSILPHRKWPRKFFEHQWKSPSFWWEDGGFYILNVERITKFKWTLTHTMHVAAMQVNKTV